MPATDDGKRTGATRGRRARGSLDRSRIIDAAVELADAGGLEALTMRAIGARLGVEGMSLYRHVSDKSDLLDGLVDRVYGGMALPPASPQWRDWLRRRAIAVHEALLRHPWATALMESRVNPGRAVLAHHDLALEVLLGAGFDPAMATRAYNLIDSYIYGFAIQQINLPFGSADELAEVGEEMLDALPMDDYPHLFEVARTLLDGGFDYAAEFEAGLDLVLDAIDRLHATTARRER